MWDAWHPQEGFEKQSGVPDPVFVPSHCLPRIWVIAFCTNSQHSAWHHKYFLNEQMKGWREREGGGGGEEGRERWGQGRWVSLMSLILIYIINLSIKHQLNTHCIVNIILDLNEDAIHRTDFQYPVELKTYLIQH